VGNRKGDNAPMAVIELVEALTVAQQAVGEAERARGTRFASGRGSGAGAAAAAGEVTADALETEGETDTVEDAAPAETEGTPEEQAEEIVDDVYLPDGERQDDGDVEPEPTAVNAAVVDDPDLSEDLATAAAAEVEAAELSDAATAGSQAEGGDAERDPE
jgi:large subunit ribosomal protein L17